MRDNLPKSAVRIEDAPCGCERYQFDAKDAMGRLMPGAGTLALHVSTCEFGVKNPAPENRVVEKTRARSKK